jgi:hypothetical protein
MDMIRPKEPVEKVERPVEPEGVNDQPTAEERRHRVRQLVAKEREKERRKVRPLKLALLAAAAVAVIGLIVAIVSANRAQYLASPEGIAAEQQAKVDQLVKKVSKLTDLPDESPLAVAISDIDKLSGQTFFAEAKNGDQVLIYEVAGRAIIYRENGNQIVNDGPIVDSASLVEQTGE